MNFINPFAFIANYFSRSGDAQNAKIGHVNAVINELNNLPSSAPLYKSWNANLTNNVLNPTTVTLFQNSLGGVQFVDLGDGSLRLISDGLFKTNKTQVLIGNSTDEHVESAMIWYTQDEDIIYLYYRRDGGQSTDLLMTSIEIRVYP